MSHLFYIGVYHFYANGIRIDFLFSGNDFANADYLFGRQSLVSLCVPVKPVLESLFVTDVERVAADADCASNGLPTEGDVVEDGTGPYNVGDNIASFSLKEGCQQKVVEKHSS